MDLGRVVLVMEIKDPDLVGHYTGSELQKVDPLFSSVTSLR